MATIAPFPHRYSVRLQDRQIVAPPRAPIAAGPPPQFGGTEQVWSPEDLLIAAVVECLWTTYEAYARRDKLEVRRWAADALGVLDKGPGGPVFTSIEVTVELDVAPGDSERALHLLDVAEKHCIISNALKAPVRVTGRVVPAAA